MAPKNATAPETPPVAPATTPAPEPAARRLYLLRIVSRTENGVTVDAPFHHHAICGKTFARFTTRPHPDGGTDEKGDQLVERLNGALNWLTDAELEEVRKKMASRFIEWRAGSRAPAYPGEVVPRVAKYRGVVRSVPEGRRPEASWEPAGNYLRIELFEGR